MRLQQIFLFWFVLLATVFSVSEAWSQSSNIGYPPISNFYKKDYKASAQNWDITQSKGGLLYFANNEGLLEFDGVDWRKYEVSNRTAVRSVKISEDGRIFVGAQGEFGYFFPDRLGFLQYHSLKSLLPAENQNFADVWDIEISENRVLFRTGNMILSYQDEKLKILYQGQSINLLAKVGADLYIQDIDKGLLKLRGGAFIPALTTASFSSEEVSSILPFSESGDTLLISSFKNGLFLYANDQLEAWPLNDDRLIESNTIYCTSKIDENTFALGTSTAGVFTINKKGQVLRRLDRSFGLQVNNVRSLFTDQSKNLWVGLDNGIDLIETSSPFTYIFPDGDLKSTGYAIRIFEDQIYFGASSGVYVNEWKDYYNPVYPSDYKLVKNSDGQVWNLSIHGADLILNHHEGAFTIKNATATKIPAQEGSWMQIPLQENKLLSGHYNGLSILEKDKTWKETIDFRTNWRESCRIIIQDKKGSIWVSHPYRGVFKVRLNEDFSKIEKVQSYNSKDGFPSDLEIYVFKIGNEAVFCAEQGIYAYDEANDTFKINEKWNTLFGTDTRVQRLIEAPNGDIWFVTDQDVGVLEVTEGSIYKKINKKVFPQLKGKVVNAFEEIYPFDEENVFIAHETGFIHYNPNQLAVDTSFNVLIRLIASIDNDSIYYGGNFTEHLHTPEIDYENNTLRFACSATSFGNIEYNEYQYFLKGLDEAWSPWSTKSQIEYTHLKAGKYEFQVQAKNIDGHLSNIAGYTFEILPPWYANQWAFLTYALLIGALFFSLVFIPKKRFEREKAALESEQKKTLQQKDQEHRLIEQQRQQQISELQNEKLELQIQSKNQELASNTMHLVQKSEMLKKIKDDIQKIAKLSKDETISKQLKKVLQKVSEDERLDNDWEQFTKHFDQVHSQFLQRLQSKYPQLSPKDHRLCAYLRMNLASKEISPLMNISVRSVEVARYRLRKKLGLEGEVNLVDFMMRF